MRHWRGKDFDCLSIIILLFFHGVVFSVIIFDQPIDVCLISF